MEAIVINEAVPADRSARKQSKKNNKQQKPSYNWHNKNAITYLHDYYVELVQYPLLK